MYLGLYSGYQHLSLSTCCLGESGYGVQLHLSSTKIRRIVWHSYRSSSVNLDSGFSCTGLFQVSWQCVSVTVLQRCSEGDPGVTLLQVCLGAR